ncbi:MAG: hypothetical protein JW876_01060 [Candidatus Krumholzibacteriota bacterium]|nr:hypothetical protein [Candidatus Krumholzibacteriota bacterium]
MKKLLLGAAILAVTATGANAMVPLGYMGLYADGERGSWCVTGVGFYPVEMWIWALPGELGSICAEYMIAYPANVIQSTVTFHDPIISVALGNIASGLSVCFTECRYDWYWIAHQLLYVTGPEKTAVRIVAHPDVGVYQFANCTPGYPLEPLVILTNLYINYGFDDAECMGTAVEEASWGAIKSMLD